MQNIWKTLPKPILALAPMDDVTDTTFRQIIRSCCHSRGGADAGARLLDRGGGNPAPPLHTNNSSSSLYKLYNFTNFITYNPLFFTEFINTDDIVHHYSQIPDQKLKFSPKEKPLIAQIWGNKPENFYKAAQHIATLGFDGIDINMGCPDKNVMKQCGGSGIINHPSLAQEIIQATREGVETCDGMSLPISVKTRLGINQIQTETWIAFLLDQNLDALTIHARTAAEMSKAPAHWEEFGKIVQLKNQKQKTTIILGNGDIETIPQAQNLITQYGLDGIMFGRAIFKNPWLFHPTKNPETVSPEEKIQLLRSHLQLFTQTWGTTKNFHILRKYFKIYLTHFPGAKELLRQLMEMKNEEEVNNVLKTFTPS